MILDAGSSAWAGVVSAVVVAACLKTLDVIVGRAKAAREGRDEMRADLKLQIERRQAAEAREIALHATVTELWARVEDCEEKGHSGKPGGIRAAEAQVLVEKIAELQQQLYDAESAARYSVELAKKWPLFQADTERKLAYAHEQRADALADNAELRKQLDAAKGERKRR